MEMLESEGYRVIAFSTIEEMLQSGMDDSHPGCIVLGVQTLGPGGLELQESLTSRSDLPVILVTASTTAREVVRAMKQGAADLFCNPLDEAAFLSAVSKAVTDHRTIAESRERQAALKLRRASLSPREREVFELMILGTTSKSIRDRLGVAERTLKHHRSRVMEKMGVKSIVQLVLAIEGSKQ
jgi:FixJ family two-component response regulator